MEDWQEWDYLEDEILVRKRRKICITCNHFRYSTTSSCVTILTCPFHQKLIPQGDHLIKGCRYWRENSKIFAPEAAWASGSWFHRDISWISLWLASLGLSWIGLQTIVNRSVNQSLKSIAITSFLDLLYFLTKIHEKIKKISLKRSVTIYILSNNFSIRLKKELRSKL